MLGPNQGAAVKEANLWVQRVVEESGFDAIQNVFCGMHEGTIPAAVLSASGFQDKVASGEKFLCFIQKQLSRLAMPAAVLVSDLLQHGIGDDEQVDPHGSLAILVEFVLCSPTRKSVQSQQPQESFSSNQQHQLLVVLTHSPVSHLEKTGLTIPTTSLHLGFMGCEKDLVGHLTSFYADPSEEDRLLIVQCDPLITRQSLIDHAKRLCVQVRARTLLNLSQPVLGSAGKRHVLFLIHLPPSAKSQERDYCVDLFAPWQFYFLDDVRPEDNGLNTMTMLRCSPYELCTQGLLNVREIIAANFQSALVSLQLPTAAHSDEESLSLFVEKLRMVQLLLQRPRFSELVQSFIMDILREHSDVCRSGLHIHAHLASRDLHAGSLRQSLQHALELVLTKALSSSLIALNADDALHLLANFIHRKEDAGEELWFRLASNTGIVDRTIVSHQCRLGEPLKRDFITNSSKHGVLCAKFPFSARIAEQLERSEVRAAVLRATEIVGSEANKVDDIVTGKSDGNDVRQGDISPRQTQDEAYAQVADRLASATTHLHQIFLLMAGEESCRLMEAWDSCAVERYLHDFVHFTFPPVKNMSVSQQMTIFDSIVRLGNQSRLGSIAAVHSSYWFSETRIAHYFSILSVFPECIPLAVQALQDASNASAVNSSYSSSDMLARGDIAFLYSFSGGVLKLLQDSRDIRVDIYQRVALIRGDIERLFCLLASHADVCFGDSTPAMLFQRWSGIQLSTICVQELTRSSKCSKELSEAVNACLLCTPWSALSVSVVFHAFAATGVDRRTMLSFVFRAFTEVIFGHAWGFTVLQHRQPYSQELIDAMLSLLNSDMTADETCTNNLPIIEGDACNSVLLAGEPESLGARPLIPSIAHGAQLRRILFSCLEKDQQCREILYSSGLSSIQSALLLISEREDECVDQVDKLTPEDVKALEWEWNSTVGRPEHRIFLEKIVRMRLHMKYIAERQLQAIAEGSIPPPFSPLLSPALSDGASFLHIFALKVIMARVGIDGLLSVFSHPLITWPVIDRSSIRSSVSLPDVFSWLVDDRSFYMRLCSAIRTVCSSAGDVTPLQTILRTQGRRVSKTCLFGAFSSQAVLDQTVVSTSGLRVVQAWLKAEIVADFPVRERSFLSWVCDGCDMPEAPNVQQCMNIRDASLLQLLLHLGFRVILRPDSWEYALLVNPSSVEHSYFPTMPSSLIATIAKASGGVGWYKVKKERRGYFC